jgi:hypothetical protein
LVVLRVPLDADRKVGPSYFDRFYGAVVSKADRLHLATELVDGLVVMAAAHRLGTEYRGHGAAGVEGHPVRGHLARCRTVSIAAEHIRQVLVQGAVQADIEHLKAATNRKQG